MGGIPKAIKLKKEKEGVSMTTGIKITYKEIESRTLSDKTAAKLTEKLDMVQKRCRERTYCGLGSITDDLLEIIEACPIKAKKNRVGIKFYLDRFAQAFPAAYKYTPESTHISGTYTTTGLEISISRSAVLAPTKRLTHSHYNEAQILDILRSAGVYTASNVESAFNYYKNNVHTEIRG